MTTYPSPQQPYMQSPPTGPVRPGSVTAIAIIGIVFGAIGLLCKPAALGMLFVPQPGPNPALDMQKDMMGWTVGSTAVGVAASLLLLASSIGALSLKPWARKGLLAYAALAVLMNVVNLVVSLIWIVPKMQEIQQQQGAGAPAGMAAIMQTAGTVGAVVGFLITMIFPALVYYYMTRPQIVALFEGGGGPGFPTGPYGGPPGGMQQPGGYYAQPPGTYPPPRM
jgi:hypothetical protein